MNKGFCGWYYKHQKDGRTLALIPGISREGAFIQVITQGQSFWVRYPASEFSSAGGTVTVGASRFSAEGIDIDIHDGEVRLTGKLRYGPITPIAYDIMGPFKYFPMECRHGIVSLYHKVSGSIVLGGQVWDFSQGLGYIEMDGGTSFPKRYTWIQCNDFDEPCSIVASVAHIPFLGFSFQGCICVVWHGGQEYRLATYKGVKVIRNEPGEIELKQGGYRLSVTVPEPKVHPLSAPERGAMKRTIYEAASCRARFQFFDGNRVVFDRTSAHASYEFV